MVGHGVVVAGGVVLCVFGVLAAVDLFDRLQALGSEWSGSSGSSGSSGVTSDGEPEGEGEWSDAWTAAVIAVLCGGAGLAVLVLGGGQAQRQLTWMRRARALPQAPWDWRLEWSDRVVRPQPRPALLAGLLAAWLAVLLLPLAALGARAAQTSFADHGPVLAVLATALVVALGIAWRRLHDARQRRSHGATLRLDRWPLHKGRDVLLTLRRPSVAPELTELRTLTWCDEVQSGGRSLRRERLWEAGAVQARLGPGQSLHTRVRLPARLPDSAPDPDAAMRHEWRLQVQWHGLHTPLVFELPVFTSASALAQQQLVDTAPAHAVDDLSIVVELLEPSDLDAQEIAQALALQGIRSTWDGDAPRLIELPARRHRRVLFGLGAFNLAWSVLVVLMLTFWAPWFFTLAFAAFGLLFWVLFVRLLRSGRVVRLDDDGVRIGKPGAVDTAPAHRYGNIRVELSMRSGPHSYYDIVGDVGGQAVKLVAQVSGRHLAHALAGRVRAVAQRPARCRNDTAAAG